MRYPRSNEAGYWSATMTAAQQAVWNRLMESALADWPPRVLDQVREIIEDWNLGFCGDLLAEAVACCVHHDVHGTMVPADLKAFMDGREELAG